MKQRTRATLAVLILAVAVPVALFFGGGGVVACLGPLGVTEVQCAKATGLFSSVGLGAPLLALAIALALVVAVPVARRGLAATLILAGGGAALGAALFLAFWPRTLDGFDSRGQWLSVSRPLDLAALATAVIAGAVVGFVIGAAWSRRSNPSHPEAGRLPV
jgi:hypothetical protein